MQILRSIGYRSERELGVLDWLNFLEVKMRRLSSLQLHLKLLKHFQIVVQQKIGKSFWYQKICRIWRNLSSKDKVGIHFDTRVAGNTNFHFISSTMGFLLSSCNAYTWERILGNNYKTIVLLSWVYPLGLALLKDLNSISCPMRKKWCPTTL